MDGGDAWLGLSLGLAPRAHARSGDRCRAVGL